MPTPAPNALTPVPEVLPRDPGYYYSPILPLKVRLGADGKPDNKAPLEWAIPGLAHDLLHDVQVPGQVLRGEVAPTPELAAKLGLDLMGLGLGVGGAPEGALAMTSGWHGTPHVFEPEPGLPFGAFKDTAIGTGEGHAAYGHGHYIAGAKGTGEQYRLDLTGPEAHDPVISYNGKSIAELQQSPGWWDLPEVARLAMEDMQHSGLTMDNWAKNRAMPHNAQYGYGPQIDWMQANRNALTESEPPAGALLNVLIKPDEGDLLHWDRSLREQPGVVDKLLASPGLEQGYKTIIRRGEVTTGRELYQEMAGNVGKEEVSRVLAKAGIPGIRYLDQGSRGNGWVTQRADGKWEAMPGKDDRQFGILPLKPQVFETEAEANKALGISHNFVIFNPADLLVTGRNGEHLALEASPGDPFGLKPVGIVKPSPGVEAFHATPQGELTGTTWRPYTHFGTQQAAEDRLRTLLRDNALKTSGYKEHIPFTAPYVKTANQAAEIAQKYEGAELARRQVPFPAPAIYPVKLAAKNPVKTTLRDVGDWENWGYVTEELHHQGVISLDEAQHIATQHLDPLEYLLGKGHDMVSYVNAEEHPGSVSHIVLDPNIVKLRHELVPIDHNPLGVASPPSKLEK